MPTPPFSDIPWKGDFPDAPNWSENFLLAGYDPKCGVGFWLHCGRWRHDLTMWRETVVVRMPDGTVAAQRAIGNARASESGPGGPHYAIRVPEQGSHLTYSYNGGVRRLPAQSMREALVADGPRTPMSYELTFKSDADIWDLKKVGHLQDFLPAGHIEQMGRVTGTIRLGKELYDIDTLAIRDHSLGPRDNKNLINHQWHQGYFENGISFMLYDAVTGSAGNVAFSEAVVYEGDKLYEANLEMGWRCDDASKDGEPISFKLHYEKGTLEIEVVEYQSNSYLSMTSPNDIYVGVYPSKKGKTLVLLEQSVGLLMNGAVQGYGCFERTTNGTIEAEA